MKDEKIDWDFNALTWSRYEIVLSMQTSNRMFQLIFNKSKPKLEQKIGVKVDYRPIDKFSIPKGYYKLLETILGDKMKKLFLELKGDKIEVINSNITDAVFTKIADVWKIKIKYEGDYADKR